ncbi:hypothetical protein AAF712_003968 [Marasmius tenuissimus]|uniref:Uncharacterized protein n=1 Tax=Marasmius tenuissimus TaxID=585030 RepID=A0ABR3A642_9AGAR
MPSPSSLTFLYASPTPHWVRQYSGLHLEDHTVRTTNGLASMAQIWNGGAAITSLKPCTHPLHAQVEGLNPISVIGYYSRASRLTPTSRISSSPLKSTSRQIHLPLDPPRSFRTSRSSNPPPTPQNAALDPFETQLLFLERSFDPAPRMLLLPCTEIDDENRKRKREQDNDDGDVAEDNRREQAKRAPDTVAGPSTKLPMLLLDLAESSCQHTRH